MRGQREEPVAPPGLAGAEVEREVAEAEDLALRAGPAPEERPQPGQQLGQRERLDEVVVGAGVETLHTVVDGVAGGQHEDRRVVAGRPQPPADGQAVEAGEPEVEHDRVGRAEAQDLQRGRAVGGRLDLVALESQGAVEGAT